MEKWYENYTSMRPKTKSEERSGFRKIKYNVIARAVAVIACIVYLVVFLYAVYYNFSLPTVYESYSGRNCVRVDDVRGTFSCENMPKAYHHVWIR